MDAVRDMQKSGVKVSLAHFNHIYPLPKNTELVFGKFRKIIVCELNLGQFAFYLRSMIPEFEYHQFNKIQGLPFMIAELKAKFNEILKELKS